MKKDIKPIFIWAKEKGDVNIYDRILMKMMPEFLNEGLQLTSESIESLNTIEVSQELYSLVVQKAQELVGEDYV